MMTNDISTLNGALNELGETLADNLSQMGVDDAVASDGLTTLANKILDIEPSVAGLELSTSIDCNVSSNKILLGQSVVFSATLSASYDDTSIEDIDISGVLTGATVLFKTSGGVILGSGVTDVNGVATYTHTFEDMGSIVVHTEFGGSTNFNSCISQNDVTVECSYDFDVTVDKEILSAKDNDVATFNCRLSDGTGGVVGESIDYRILHNDIVLSSGSRVTDENGEITLEYAATGVGNVDVIFSLRSILQKTYEVCDAWKYVETLTLTGNGTLNYHIINQISSYQGDAVFSVDYIKTDNHLDDGGGLILGDRVLSNQVLSSTAFNGVKLGQYNTTRGFYEYNTSSPTDYRSSATDDRNIKHNLTIIKQNNQLRGIVTRLTDNTVIYDRTITPKSSDYTYFQLCVWTSAVFVFSDIIIKPL